MTPFAPLPARIHRKRILLRVDFNVPIERGKIMSVFRIEAALPSIRGFLKGENTVVLLSHHSSEHQSLLPVARYLERRLHMPVGFLRNPLSSATERRIGGHQGGLFLVENLIRWPGERSESEAFARHFARLGDIFINDSFGEAHRRRALITKLPKFLPSYAGPLFRKELALLRRVLSRPARPLVVIFGGAKIETKLPILVRFSRFADQLLVGGAIANTILKARGVRVGKSKIDAHVAPSRLKRIARSHRVISPVDAVVIGTGTAARASVRAIGTIGERERIYDTGPKTDAVFRSYIEKARTIVWNGPLGLTEEKRFTRGTLALARALLSQRGAVLVGGGDTIAFLERYHMLKKFTHVSLGGGAMLAYLAGEKLPAIEALRKRS